MSAKALTATLTIEVTGSWRLMGGRSSLATFLHLKTNEPLEERTLTLTAIRADAINLGLAKMSEV